MLGLLVPTLQSIILIPVGRMAKVKISNIDCIEVKTGPDNVATNLGVLLMHGYGASPDQFTTVVDYLLQLNPDLANKRIRWIFPFSPTQDGPVGSEWFPLDIGSWMMAFMGGEQLLATKLRATPTGMNESAEKIISLLGELIATTDGAGSTLAGWCIGGFSQGSMMTCSVVSRLGLPDQDRSSFGDCISPGGMLILSGMCMNIEEWSKGFAHQKGKGIKCLQLHGRSDMTCPFHASGWLKDLIGMNIDVQYHAHNGAHDMGGADELKKIASYLNDLA